MKNKLLLFAVLLISVVATLIASNPKFASAGMYDGCPSGTVLKVESNSKIYCCIPSDDRQICRGVIPGAEKSEAICGPASMVEAKY